MAFVLVFGGLLLIVTGVNNTYVPLGSQLKTDAGYFVPFAVAIGAVGAIGYINDPLRRFSHYFMALILIALVLSNKGFFQNFTAGIKATPVAPSASGTSSAPLPTTGLFGSFTQGGPNANTLLNLGPLGTIDKPSIDPNSWLGKLFGQ